MYFVCTQKTVVHLEFGVGQHQTLTPQHVTTVTLNVKKTVFMMFIPSFKNQCSFPAIVLDGQELTQVIS